MIRNLKQNSEEKKMDVEKNIIATAFEYCKAELIIQDLLGVPDQNIVDSAIIMGEMMKDAIIGVIDDFRHISIEELYDDPDIQEEDLKDCAVKKINIRSEEYKFNTVLAKMEHPRWSLPTLKKHGFAAGVSSWKTIRDWEVQFDNGGSSDFKFKKIDEDTLKQFQAARTTHKTVTITDLRRMALTSAMTWDLPDFKASSSWLDNFKRKHSISKRKITKFISTREMISVEEINERARIFQNQLSALVQNYPARLVINTDQTGCQIQMTTDRTYSTKGEKKTFACYENIHKTTHSYTAQYSVTLEGKLLPLVFLCLQEPTGQFGPIVKRHVDDLVERCGNVYVTCSKSGKLSTMLYKAYLNHILKPYVTHEKFLLVIDSWSGQTNTEIYDNIFDNGENETTCTVKVIPGKCTSMCQPLDVYFFRQVKNLIKRIQLAEMDCNTREDCIKIHSIIHHQLSAPVFEPMIKYAWYASGVEGGKPSFKNLNQVCFPSEIYRRRCQKCDNLSFIQCAVCVSILCFKCFYKDFHANTCYT